jgi:hypothetical protein
LALRKKREDIYKNKYRANKSAQEKTLATAKTPFV